MMIIDTIRSLMRRLRNRLFSYKLSQLSRTVTDEGLTYLSPTKLRRMQETLDSVQDIEGDFAEFGVALGGSAILIANEAGGRKFHGFDVFGMIPEPASEKDDQKSKSRYETIKSGVSRGIDGQQYYGYRDELYSEVKDSFYRHGLPVGENGIYLHKGLFEDTWPIVQVDLLAFVHLDCDWYDPVAYCLREVAKKLSPGGVIMIDDYHDYGGCRIAVEEFLSQNPDYRFEDGANPVLRRKI
jgi:O-methyltransferase